MYYTDNDFRLYHSAKGTTWKKHKYSAKKSNGGKVRYIYTSKDYQEDIDEAKKEEIRAENEYKDARYRNIKADEESRGPAVAYDTINKYNEDYLREMQDKGYELRTLSEQDELDANYKATSLERSAASQRLNAARNRRASAERAYQNYLNTPLGKVESAVQTGREFISNLIKRR